MYRMPSSYSKPSFYHFLLHFGDNATETPNQFKIDSSHYLKSIKLFSLSALRGEGEAYDDAVSCGDAS